jgi:arginase family enzyme
MDDEDYLVISYDSDYIDPVWMIGSITRRLR